MSRGSAVLALIVAIGASVIAYQVLGLIGLYLADIHPALPEAEPGPAPWEVSALIEEARRITGEAAP